MSYWNRMLGKTSDDEHQDEVSTTPSRYGGGYGGYDSGKSSRPSYFRYFSPKTPQEVIKPDLHYIDRNSLRLSLDHYFKNLSSILSTDKATLNLLQMIMDKSGLTGKVSTYDDLVRDISDAYENGAYDTHVSNDIFGLFYNKMDRIDFRERQLSNTAKFKILERVNNPVTRILCSGSPLKTMIVTRSLMLYLIAMQRIAFHNADQDKADDAIELQKSLKQDQNPDIAPSPKDQTPPPPKPAPDPAQNQTTPPDPVDPADQMTPQEQQAMQDLIDSMSQKPPDPANQGQPSPCDQADQGNQQGPGDQPGSGAQPGQNGTPSNGLPDLNSAGGGSYSNAASQGVGQDQVTAVDAAAAQALATEQLAAIEIQRKVESLVRSVLGTSSGATLMEHQLETAAKQIRDIEAIMSADEIKDSWKDIQHNTEVLQRIDPHLMDAMKAELKELKMNMSSVREHIKLLLNRSINYFSAKEIPYFESFLDADSIDGIQDMCLLHPRLRNLFIMDIQVKETRRVGKINVYVDTSSSMNSSSGATDEKGNTIKRMTFAKALTMRLKDMDLMENLYTFDMSIHDTRSDMVAVLSMKQCGGTSIDAVVEHIQQTGKNSIVITDANDSCSEYDSKAFFIGIAGANFRGFSKVKEYSEAGQLCVFDGHHIFDVDQNGYQVR